MHSSGLTSPYGSGPWIFGNNLKKGSTYMI
jgi:hypothetical protein